MAEDEELPEPTGEYTLEAPAGERKDSHGFSGKGKATYQNGDSYDGVYENGIRSGPGSYFYRSTRDTFKGTFEDNKKGGVAEAKMGRMEYGTGGKKGFYQGYFKNGKREGEGTFQYPNRDIYSGMWKDGKRHGKGTYVYADTKYELKGTWKEGKIVQGTWTFTDGTRYVGVFQDSKPCGDGIWETKQGTIVEGAYVQQVVPSDDKEGKKPDGTPWTETRIFWNTATMVAVDD